ncbi:MAG: hypothetical protein WBG36_13900 [Ornithinimicrobium sp.]
MSTPPRSIEPWLIDILRCPVGVHPLRPDSDAQGEPVLACDQDCPEPGSRRHYPIKNGIPVLLESSSVVVAASGS